MSSDHQHNIVFKWNYYYITAVMTHQLMALSPKQNVKRQLCSNKTQINCKQTTSLHNKSVINTNDCILTDKLSYKERYKRSNEVKLEFSNN